MTTSVTSQEIIALLSVFVASLFVLLGITRRSRICKACRNGDHDDPIVNGCACPCHQ